jgi:hypothetical protein
MYFSLKALCFFAFPIIFLGQAPSSENDDLKAMRVSQEARNAEAKGTRLQVPGAILAQVEANPENCTFSDPGESKKLDAYRVAVTPKGRFVIVVWGRSSCYCGATGNCDFWIFRKANGKYIRILETHSVRDYGFVSNQTNGYRDLVVWSHGSAYQSSVRLFHFDGEQYDLSCGWEEEYEITEGTNAVANDKPAIVDNSCQQKDSGRK